MFPFGLEDVAWLVSTFDADAEIAAFCLQMLGLLLYVLAAWALVAGIRASRAHARAAEAQRLVATALETMAARQAVAPVAPLPPPPPERPAWPPPGFVPTSPQQAKSAIEDLEDYIATLERSWPRQGL